MNKKQLDFFKSKEIDLFYKIGETILGIPKSDLTDAFIKEADRFINTLDSFLFNELHKLLFLVNSRFISFLTIFRFKKFQDLSPEKRENFFLNWSNSKIPILRTGFTTLKAICGWSFYSLEKCWDEIGFLGPTIGKENVTPTLLFGKSTWEEMIKRGEVDL